MSRIGISGARRNFLLNLGRSNPTTPKGDISHSLEYGFNNAIHQKVDEIRAKSQRVEDIVKEFFSLMVSSRNIDSSFINDALGVIREHQDLSHALQAKVRETDSVVEPLLAQDEHFRWMLDPSKDVVNVPNYLKHELFAPEVDQEIKTAQDIVDGIRKSSLEVFNLRYKLGLRSEFGDLSSRYEELKKLSANKLSPHYSEADKIRKFFSQLLIETSPDQAQKLLEQMDDDFQLMYRDGSLFKLAVFYGVPLRIFDHLDSDYDFYLRHSQEYIIPKGLEDIKKLHASFNARGINTQVKGAGWMRLAMMNDYPKADKTGKEDVFIRSLRNLDSIQEFDNSKKPYFKREPHPFGLGRWCEFRALVAMLQAQDELEHKIIVKKDLTDPRLITNVHSTFFDNNADKNNIDFWLETIERSSQEKYMIPIQVKHSKRSALEAKQGKLGVDSISIENKTLNDLRSNIRSIARNPKVKITESDFNALYSTKRTAGDFRSKLTQLYSQLQS